MTLLTMSYLSDLLNCHGDVPALCSNVCSLQKKQTIVKSCRWALVIIKQLHTYSTSGIEQICMVSPVKIQLKSWRESAELGPILLRSHDLELRLWIGTTAAGRSYVPALYMFIPRTETPQLIVDSRVDRNLRHYHTNVGTFYLLINLILSVSQDFALKCEFNGVM